MGFEPTRAEHIGLAVQRLNHSATSSDGFFKNGIISVLLQLETEVVEKVVKMNKITVK